MKVVGQPLPKMDALDKVLGAAQYAADVQIAGALIGKVLQSTYAHARILSIDTSEAEALPGVKAVVTARDLPDVRQGSGGGPKDQPLLARERVRYMGEPVAAVAAVDERTARQALELITVAYEALPAVFDPLEAMKPDAPVIREGPPSGDLPPNVVSYSGAARGDVEAAFARADYVFEDTFRTQMQHHAYTEPPSATATYDQAGKITIWTSSKAIFRCRNQTADYLGVPRNNVRVIGTYVGGAFGAKGWVTVEPIAAALARKARRPVRLTLGRHEDFTMGTPRHPTVITLKTGVMKDGTLVARQVRSVFDTGAYSTLGPQITSAGTEWVLGPYKFYDYQIDAYCVFTNKVSCGAFRGFGTLQVHFASESQMDMIARRLGMDPAEIRLKNAAEDNWIAPNGQRIPRVPLKESLRTVIDMSGWGKRQLPPNRALGIAAVIKHGGTLASAADIRMQEDGTFVLAIGAVDCGQGSDMILAQIAAEILGVPVEDVKVPGKDTDISPYDWNTAASRLTVVAGSAVLQASEDLKGKILDLAAHTLEAAPEDLDLDNREVRVRGAPDRRVSLAELGFDSHWREGGQLAGHASVLIEGHRDELPRFTGVIREPHAAVTVGATVVEVEVDPETGHTRVVKVWTVHDVGKAINPMAAEGQIEGSVVTGVGFALSEELVIEDGIPKTTLLNDYLVPMPPDAPEIESKMLEAPDEEAAGPFGAKPIGEHALLGIAPAVAAAVEQITGARVTSLPITPEKIVAAMAANGAGA